MYKLIRIAVLVTGSLLFGFSANAMTLCASPLPTDCIVPQWGAVEPDSDALTSDGQTGLPANSAAAASLPAAEGSNVGGHIRLAQMRKPTRTSYAPNLLINDVRRFDRETKTLVRAIEQATFDREGNLKTGASKIDAAVDALRKASKDHQLNLYIKVPTKLRSRDGKILVAKVQAVNEVIKKAASDTEYPKKAPNS